MRINKLLYAVIPVSIVLFGLFIYPTMYKYDKLQQNYPVKINRITGDASILTANGWVTSGDYDNANEKMLSYKKEIEEMISQQNDAIAAQVISEITDDIISDVETQLDLVKSEIEIYKKFETDPENYFTIGDTKETVKKIMGVPDQIDKYFDAWWYGISNVKFSNNKVTEWNNQGGNLRIR